MSTADAVLAEIERAPDDDQPRLVWADVVGGERGELVALQCARAELAPDQHAARNARERTLLAAHGVAWSGLGGIARRVQYRRGFVDAIEIDATVFADRHAEIIAAAPLLTSLTLVGLYENNWRRTEATDRLERVLLSPGFANIRGLAIEEPVRGLERVLVDTGAIGQLWALEVPHVGPVLGGHVHELERLVVTGPRTSADNSAAAPEGVTGAVDDTVLRGMTLLASLDVQAAQLGSIGTLERLVDLGLRIERIDVLAELAASRVADRLERLALAAPPLDRAAVQLLAAFPKLRTLELYREGLDASALVGLELPALRELHLCAHDDATCATIDKWLGTQLDVLVTPRTPRDVELLFVGPRLPGRAHVRRALGDAYREPAWLVLTNGERAGQAWPLQQFPTPIFLGRASDAAIHLAFDTVARRHARLAWSNGRYWLEDLYSDNGTRIDGQPIHLAPLHDGARVSLGRAELELYIGPDRR